MDEFKNMEGARFGAGAADEAEELLGSKMELDSHNVTASSANWEGESENLNSAAMNQIFLRQRNSCLKLHLVIMVCAG